MFMMQLANMIKVVRVIMELAMTLRIIIKYNRDGDGDDCDDDDEVMTKIS